MCTAKVWTSITLCVAAGMAPLHVGAQQSATNVPPPQLVPLEEGEPPAVTIRGGQPAREISEIRERGGRVSSVKVRSGNSTYYLKPNAPAGSAVPGDAQSSDNRAAQWQLLEFDWAREQQRKEAAAEAAAVPEPPPLTSPAVR